jgi:hypothetical protein
LDTEQTSQDSEPVEQRLAAYFSATPEVAKPEPAATEPVQAETETATNDDEQPEAAPEDDGHDDFEADGKVYRIDRELKAKVSEWKEGHLRTQDYTRKTQELADITRQAQLMAETIQHRQALDTETKEEREKLAKVRADLELYKKVDWNAVSGEDGQKLLLQRDLLKEQAEELKASLEAKTTEFKAKFETNRKKAVEEGFKFLSKVVPNFNEESVKAARSGAMNNGYTEGELDNVYDARFVALSWKAAQYDKLQSGKSAAVASVQKAPPVVKPGASVPGAAAERKYKDVRQALKKSGSVDDFARALIARGIS